MSKKVAVMQPYFFPYLGYYQLAAVVDTFVFLDDVNYKRGWMNRNRLLISGAVQYITIPLSGASQNQKICAVQIEKSSPWREKLKRSVMQSYSKAPHFNTIFELFNAVIDGESELLSDYTKASIQIVADYLGLPTQFVATSRKYGNERLTGESRILDIAAREHAAEYYNLPGGAALYNPATFQLNQIELCFIQPHLPPYRQTTPEFHAGLSILDVLMFNSRDAVVEMVSLTRNAV